MTNEDVLKMLKTRQGELSLRDFGRVVGVTAPYLSDLYNGNREPGPKIMRFLGLRKERTVEVEYRKARA